jgi:hypothetical protein
MRRFRMRKTELDPRILNWLKVKLKGEISETTIRPAISRIARKDSSTLNEAARKFALNHHVILPRRFLRPKNKETAVEIRTEQVKRPYSRMRIRQEIIEFAKYDTNDAWLKAHIVEINKTYTCTCYTATFILCRKVLENLIAIHILERKYPKNTPEHRQKYFDIGRKRIHNFNRLLSNLRNSSDDFIPKNNIVNRICGLAEGFKEDANEMTHSLYHIATKKELDEKAFQQILNLVAELEKSIP